MLECLQLEHSQYLSHSYLRAVNVHGSAQSYSTQKALYTSTVYSIFKLCYYPCFFQDAQKLTFSFVPLLVFWGKEEDAVRRNTCHVRASSCCCSFLNPSNKKNVLILCSHHLYPRPTKCINTFFAFEDLHSECNFCFEPYLLDLMYFCL